MTEFNNFHLPYHFDVNVAQRAVNMREIERTFNDIITGEIAIASTNVGWAAWTPTVGTTAGSITSYTASGRYSTVEGTIFFTADITITDIGTGTTQLGMSLPGNAASSSGYIGSGRETVVTSDAINLILTDVDGARIEYYNGNFPGASTARFLIHGFYEAA